MNRRKPLRCHLAALAIALGVAWTTPAVADVDAGTPWLAQPYTYFGESQSLSAVLRDFGHQFGLKVSIGPDILGTVNGQISAQTPGQFLDQLSSLHGFDWFVDNGTLYITSLSSRVRKTLHVPPSMTKQVQTALQGLGIYNPRYGWGELAGQGQIIVAGPPAYVARVGSVVRGMASAPSNTQIAIYRLKYANVQDRTITYRDKLTIIPGVASIMRRLADNQAAPAAPAVPAVPARGAGGDSPPPLPEVAWNGPQPAAIIDADVRLNAVIVKAAPDVQPFYKQLISQLDVDVPLVQIEVTILDIDSDLAENLGVSWTFSNIPGATVGAAASLVSAPFSAALTTILPRGFNLGAQVHLLEKQGRGQVISKPSLLTMDNTQALFDTNETSYIRTVGERAVETTPVSAGLMIKVTPRVIDTAPGEHRRIMLQLDIEDGKRVNSTAEELPVFKTSAISTQAVIGDAESLLIAGHHRQDHQKTTNQVPFLGSLPGIGSLFRHTHETQFNRTRFFVVTPRIVRALSVETTAGSAAFRQAREMNAGTDPTQAVVAAPLASPLATPLATSLAKSDPASAAAAPPAPQSLPPGFREVP